MEGVGERGKGRVYKAGFWNVAGVEDKDKDFWESLKEWDVLVLNETWIQKKRWEKIRGRMPKGYIWEVQEAGERNKNGERWVE